MLLSADAGTRLDPEVVAAAFAHDGVAAEIVHGSLPALLARTQRIGAESLRAVVVGGGDGTLGAIAGVLAGGAIPLGVLACGTRNHFARDLGLILPLSEAVRVIGAGYTSAIDVGSVNGHVFVNNSSLGLYPEMVRERESGGRRFGVARTLATLLATLRVLRRLRLMRVRVDQGGESRGRTTPFVFVGNNAYSMHLFALGSRARVDAGQLSLYTARTTNRWALFRLMLAALGNRLDQNQDFDASSVSEAWIETRRHQVRVAVDGEVLALSTPLHYRCWPRALRVLVPAPAPAPA